MLIIHSDQYKQHRRTVTVHSPIYWGTTRPPSIRPTELEPSMYTQPKQVYNFLFQIFLSFSRLYLRFVFLFHTLLLSFPPCFVFYILDDFSDISFFFLFFFLYVFLSHSILPSLFFLLICNNMQRIMMSMKILIRQTTSHISISTVLGIVSTLPMILGLCIEVS